MSYKRIDTKYGMGLVVILIGALLLLRNLDVIDFAIPQIIFSWQVVLIIIGSLLIINSKNKSTGLVLIIVGGLGLIPEYWAIALILLGLFIIFRKSGFSFGRFNGEQSIEEGSANEKISEVSLFGGGDRYFHTDNFKGGNITSVFGGSKIDLMDCSLAEGENIIDLFFVFGGSSFKIPSNWQVQIQTTSIFGGFSDKRILPAENSFEDGKVLILKGLILFGGGEIKNHK